MIRAVIFDCFGVLYQGSLEALAAMVPPEKRQELHDVNIAKDYGYVDYQEYLRQMGAVLGLAPTEVGAIMEQRHVPNQPLIAYAEQLKSHHKTALLSNIGNHTMDGLFGGQVQAMFSEVVLSYQVGLVKPSPEIYMLTANRLGVLPEECVMVDDLLANCEGAQAVGMRSILHTSNRATIGRVNELLEASNA